MPLYRRKITTVDAEQFTDSANPPRGVQVREHAEDTPPRDIVYFVETIQGQVVRVAVGEWIVAESDGKHFYPVADAIFRSIYEPQA